MGYLTFDVNVVFQRNTDAEWAAENPVVRPGELVVESNTNRIKIGDGVTPYNSLPYSGVGGGDPGAQYPLSENIRPPTIVNTPDRTFVLSDVGKMLVLTRPDPEAPPTTLTLVANADLPVGTLLKGINVTFRDAAIVAGDGVTIFPAGHVVHGNLGQFQLYQAAHNYWYLMGDVGIPST